MISIKSTEVVTSTPPTYFKKWHLNQQLVIDIEGVIPGQIVDFFSDVQDNMISTVVYESEVQDVYVCDVPNILLTRDHNIQIFIDVKDPDGNVVSSHNQTFRVEDARKPDGYVYTETPVVHRNQYYHDTYPVFTKRFKTGTTAVGNPVVMSENDKVKNGAGGTAPVGFLLSKDGYQVGDSEGIMTGVVKIKGEISCTYPRTGGNTPSLGINELVCDGSGGLRKADKTATTPETGRMCLVTGFYEEDLGVFNGQPQKRYTMTVILL